MTILSYRFFLIAIYTVPQKINNAVLTALQYQDSIISDLETLHYKLLQYNDDGHCSTAESAPSLVCNLVW